MADISSYLAQILAAVHGEVVRGSIHDAIELINNVSEVVLTTGNAVTGPTSSSTGFYEDSLYLNTTTYELWKCVGTNSWTSQGIIKGSNGNGIASIAKTSTVGLVDTYTITLDDGTTQTFNVTNGADGTDGSVWYKGTALTGTGTSITGFGGNQNDFYLNSTTGNVYICTSTGGASAPGAATWDYVMTLSGGGGSSVTVVDNLTSTSTTDALSANQGRVLNAALGLKADTSSLATVATSGSYADLSNKPTIDDWAATASVSSGSVTFSGVDDSGSYGYDVYFDVDNNSTEKNPYALFSTNSGEGTSNMSVTYTTNADNGTNNAKLRRIK